MLARMSKVCPSRDRSISLACMVSSRHHQFGDVLPMDIISADCVTPAITALFDATKPTMLRAFTVLEGTSHGQILVDDMRQPTWALVRDPTYGTLYLGGQYTPSLLATLVDQFRHHGAVGIGCWPDDPLTAMLPPKPDYAGTALYFRERFARVASSIDQALPAPYRLARRDAEHFRQSFDYESTLAALGSVENVVRLTLGVVVLDENIVVCEAATGVATHGQIEVGVTTAAMHRQRGLATVACATLIELCAAKGYTTWWDCATHNSASTRLARKLGYQNEREYRYVEWNKYESLA
jgi:RimJ/RimL family protein N-acetyltransferase